MAVLQCERLDGAIEVMRLDRPHARMEAFARVYAALVGLVEWQRTGAGLPQGGLRG
jgi:hypothetical protein